MGTSHKVTVNNLFHFDFEKEKIQQLDVVQDESSTFHVLDNNIPYKAEILTADFYKKTYKVKINANIYTVAIAGALDQLIQDMGFNEGQTKLINSIKAPMPGLLLQINVSVGQSIKENDSLLILEAMKMENNLRSPRDGIIKNIMVKNGDSVDKDQLLIEFE